MSAPVEAERYFAQLLALRLTGQPLMGEGSSALDGRTVSHRDGEDWGHRYGVVLGPSQLPDFVWVRWGTTGPLGLHRITDLTEKKENND